jgi:hypothetical protein
VRTVTGCVALLALVALSAAVPAGCRGPVDHGAPRDGGQCANDACAPILVCGSASLCPQITCSDLVQDGDETDVDCGGAACSPCTNGQRCLLASDCASASCVLGTCRPNGACDAGAGGGPDPSGCGGPCGPPCPVAAGCQAASDCASRVCASGTCQAPRCDDGVKNGNESDVDCGGSCPKCADAKHCVAAADCVSGVCAGGVCQAPHCNDGVKNGDETDVDCGGTSCPRCTSGKGCVASTDCAATLVCAGQLCGPCTSHAQCPSGQLCDYGACVTGSLVQMYQCPGPVSLGGGHWGYYGCQNQITNASTCYEIEAPTTQTFSCAPAGKLALLSASAPDPAGTVGVPLYQCPGPVSLGGGAWGFYGCQSQITNTPTCYEIEYPTSMTFDCAPVGKMSLVPTNASAPAGAKVTPMYQCPGVVSLGGGQWGYYGCQNQITNTSSCYEIEAPTTQTFACAADRAIILY